MASPSTKIGDTYTLNEGEQAVAKLIAQRRNNQNRENNVRDSKIDPSDSLMLDVEGFAAELAFCALFNAYPDFSIQPRNAASDKGDATIEGQSVDVKTTRYDSGRLLAVRWKKHTVDLYCLMTGTFPTYRFRGFLPATELLQSDRLGGVGRGETYVAEQSELLELNEAVASLTTEGHSQ